MRTAVLLFTAAAFVSGSVFAAQAPLKNLVVNGNAAMGLKNWQGFQKIANESSNDECFQALNRKLVHNIDKIPIDNQAKYTLSAEFKSGNGNKNRVYFGLLMFDANKKTICPGSVTIEPGSETALAAPCKKGDTVIQVKDASKWQDVLKKRRLIVAFNADDSGKYKDLPNTKLSSKIVKLEKKKDFWTAILAKPLDFDVPKKTVVRAHYDCSHYMYIIAFCKNLKKWTKYSGVVRPAGSHGSPGRRFWKGARFVQVLILANWGQKNGRELLVSNISFTKDASAKNN
jgi:hypothetical protein